MRFRLLLFSILFAAFLIGGNIQTCDGQQSLLKQEYSPLNFRTIRSLSYPDMAKELELTEGQIKEIWKLWKSLTKQNTEKFFSIPSDQLQRIINDPKLNAAREEDMRKWRVDADLIAKSQLQTILTDKQQSRILELSIWKSLNGGVINALNSEPFKSMIKNDNEASKLAEKFANKNRDEFEKELAELKKKYRDQLNKELTEEQRKKLSKTLGKDSKIDLHPENRPY